MSLKLCRTVTSVLYAAACILAVLALLVENTATLFWILTVAVILVSIGIKMKYWRCPKCKTMLPNGRAPRECPNCSYVFPDTQR